jgi:hypothetical protein
MTGLHPFLSYYGSKWRSAARYPAPGAVRGRADRVAHRPWRPPPSSVDITGELMRTRDILRAEAERLTEAISAATTIR